MMSKLFSSIQAQICFKPLAALGLVLMSINGQSTTPQGALTKQPSDVKTAPLVLKIEGIKVPSGYVRLAVYGSAQGWPDKPDLAVRKVEVPVKQKGTLVIQLGKLPAGKYAISAYHDANANNKLDVNWVGIPKEPYGMSNNARGTMGPPKFSEAQFALQDSLVHTFKLH